MTLNNSSYHRFDVAAEIRQGLDDYEFDRQDRIEGELIALALADYAIECERHLDLRRVAYYRATNRRDRMIHAREIVDAWGDVCHWRQALEEQRRLLA